MLINLFLIFFTKNVLKNSLFFVLYFFNFFKIFYSILKNFKNSYEKITFDSLPNKFVLKANHASGMNILIDDKNNINITNINNIILFW